MAHLFGQADGTIGNKVAAKALKLRSKNTQRILIFLKTKLVDNLNVKLLSEDFESRRL